MTVPRFFILPIARASAPAGYLASLLARLRVGKLSELHGRDPGEVAQSAAAPLSSIAVMEGLLEDLGCGFIVKAGWDASGAQPKALPMAQGSVTEPTSTASSNLAADDLGRPLSTLPFSVRAVNCFAYAGVRSVGDLIQRTEEELLKVRNLGQNTVAEIKQVLGTLGLGLGQSRVSAPRMWPVSAESATRLVSAGIDTLPKLARLRERTLLESGLVSLEELLQLAAMVADSNGEGFAPAERVLKRLHLNLNLLVRFDAFGHPLRSLMPLRVVDGTGRLFDAWTLGKSTIEAGIGPAALGSLERVLKARGLSLDQAIDSRIASHAEELANLFSAELADPPAWQARYMDDEVRVLSGLDGDDRNTSAALHCLGWDGGAGSTLEAAGSAVGLSRERVRQLRKGALEQLAAKREAAVLLEGAVAFIASRVPAWAEQLEVELVEAGVCRRALRLEGLLAAASACGIAPLPRLIDEADLRILVGEGDEGKVRTLLKTTRRRSKAQGLAAARALCLAELRGEPVDRAELLREDPLFPAAVASAPPPPVSTAVPVVQPRTPDGRAFPAEGNTEAIAEWLLQAARDQGLVPANRPWSLAELPWNSGVSAGLRQWGRQGALGSDWELSRPFLLAGARVSGRECAALVFLALTAEVGRREGHEGELWPAVRKALGASLKERFFHEAGMLRSWLRDALERICPRLGLRHVLGQEGVHAWVRTAFLQFGITDAGWERLPWWLYGQPTSITVRDLLDAQGPLYSRTFADLWRTLAKARTGHKDPERLLRELRALESPWLSGADLGRVAQCALARPDIVPTPDDGADEGELSGGLFAKPRLLWPPGAEPRFILELRPDPPTGSEIGTWTLEILGHSHHVLWSREPGQWQVQGERVVVDLRETSLRVEVRRQGRTVIEDSVKLIDDDEELFLFNLASGRQVDAWSPLAPPGQGLAVLARNDLKLAPEPTEWTGVFGGAWRLWRFRSGIPEGTVASLGGQEIWRCSHAVGARRSYRGRAWCSEATRWGDRNFIRISIDEGEPLALRLGNKSYSIEGGDGAYRARVEIAPGIRPSAAARVVALVAGRRTTWPVQLQIDPPWGAAREMPGRQWTPVRAEDHLAAADLETHRLLVEPPARWQVAVEELAILEGEAFLARPRGAVRGLGASVHGLGAPLVLCRGPYNRLAQTEAVLCEAVLNSGALRAVEWADDGRLRVSLLAPVDLTTDHRIWLWRQGDQAPTPVDPGVAEWVGSDCWVSEQHERAFACALEYRGAWLGAQYVTPNGPEAFRSVIEGATEWPKSALWLRWWRAPLLLRGLCEAVEQRAISQPVETLSAWLGTPAGLEAPLRVPNDDLAWAAVVSKHLWRWVPSGLQAASLIRILGLLSGELARDLKNGWRHVDPLLMAHPVLLAAVARTGVPALFPSDPKVAHYWLLRTLRNRIAGIDTVDEAAWPPMRLELLSAAATLMGADRDFIQRSLLQEARALVNGTRHPHENLRAAMQFGAVRDFVAASLVHEFAEAAR